MPKYVITATNKKFTSGAVIVEGKNETAALAQAALDKRVPLIEAGIRVTEVASRIVERPTPATRRDL